MKRFIVIGALALAACGQEAQQRETGDAQTVAAASAFDASIGPSGAAGISAALPMNVDAVRAAAANYAVAEVDDQIEGDPFKAITLSAGGAEIFRVLPTADRAHIPGACHDVAAGARGVGEISRHDLCRCSAAGAGHVLPFAIRRRRAGLCLLHGGGRHVLARLQTAGRLYRPERTRSAKSIPTCCTTQLSPNALVRAARLSAEPPCAHCSPRRFARRRRCGIPRS